MWWTMIDQVIDRELCDRPKVSDLWDLTDTRNDWAIDYAETGQVIDHDWWCV